MPEREREEGERGSNGGRRREEREEGPTERVGVVVYNGHGGDLDGGRHSGDKNGGGMGCGGGRLGEEAGEGDLEEKEGGGGVNSHLDDKHEHVQKLLESSEERRGQRGAAEGGS